MRSCWMIKSIGAMLALCCLAGCGGTVDPAPATTEPIETTVATEPAAQTPQQMVEAFAQDNDLPIESWPDHIIAALERNPEMVQYVLEYPIEYGKKHEIDLSECAQTENVPLFIQWDKRWGYIRYGTDLVGLTGCGPTCLSMVAYYYTRDPGMSPDQIVKFSKEHGYYSLGSGSSWTLISEGAEKLGLQAQELSLSERQLKNALESGKPVIAAMGPGVFTTSGHYIVFVACEDGGYRVNDPNSREKSQKVWMFDEFKDQVRNWWAMSLAQ